MVGPLLLSLALTSAPPAPQLAEEPLTEETPLFQQLMDVHEAQGAEAALAMATFQLLEPEYEAFKLLAESPAAGTEIARVGSVLACSFGMPSSCDGEGSYAQVAALRDSPFVVRALIRQAEISLMIARALARPVMGLEFVSVKLASDQQDLFSSVLEEEGRRRSLPWRQAAAMLLERALDTAARLGLSDEWTKRARALLDGIDTSIHADGPSAPYLLKDAIDNLG